MGVLEGFRQSIGFEWNQHEMDVIGHQAVAEQRREFRGQTGRSLCGNIWVLRFECKLRLAPNGNYPSESSHSKETISANRVYLAASRKDELQLILD